MKNRLTLDELCSVGTRHHAFGGRTGRPFVGHAQGDDEPKLHH